MNITNCTFTAISVSISDKFAHWGLEKLAQVPCFFGCKKSTMTDNINIWCTFRFYNVYDIYFSKKKNTNNNNCLYLKPEIHGMNQ